MVKVTAEQLNLIQEQLSALNLHPGLHHELLDHYCCLIEVGLANGLSFEQALNNTLADFKKDEIQDLNHSIISLHKKRPFMKVLVFSVVALLLGSAALFDFTFIHLEESESKVTLIPASENTPALMIPSPKDFLTETEARLSDPPSIMPLENGYKKTSGFGMRTHPILKKLKMHVGVDFAAPMGTPVVATADGIIKKAKVQTSGYGKHILIQHDDEYSTMYAQLSKLLVKVGERVNKGDTIGLVGSSGTSSGPHLHYEVRKNGKHVDPAPYLHP